jgi:hypothetical protein
MRTGRHFAAESDPDKNRFFRRLWLEPQRRRRPEIISGDTIQKPLERPPRKRKKPALPSQSNRPILKTAQNDNTPEADEAEVRRIAEALFASGGTR